MADETLTNTELAILGLVAEGPRHGYQIEQDIAERGMRNWTEIGFSSIYYILNKLESSGWLESERVTEAGEEPARGLPRHGLPRHGLPRRVYRLTGAGWGIYRAAVRERLAHPRPRSGDFDLALANLPALPPEEARAALETYRVDLHERLSQVRAKWAADQPAAGPFLPPHVNALFDRSIALIEAELGWVEKYLGVVSSEQ